MIDQRALILAAGQGLRLTQAPGAGSKALLEVGGRTLLAHHLDRLAQFGLHRVGIVGGFRIDLLAAELDRLRGQFPDLNLDLIENRDFMTNSATSVAAASAWLSEAEDVWLMDGDVLYPVDVLERMATGGGNVLPFSREFEDGDEPVKLCLDEQGRIVGLGKQLEVVCAVTGEWLGFARLQGDAFTALLDAIQAAAIARQDGNYEDVLATVIQAAPPEAYRAVDVTGLPWTEIDYKADLEWARTTVWPAIKDLSTIAIQP